MTREKDLNKGSILKRSWRWVALGLPVLALTGAFATTALAGDGGRWGGPPDEKQAAKFMERRLERMLHRLDATPAQETQIKAVVANHREQMKAMHQERRQLRDATRAVLTAPNLDAAAVEGIRAKMLAQAEKSSRIFAQVALQVGQILTPAQRQQMADQIGHGRGHGSVGFFGF